MTKTSNREPRWWRTWDWPRTLGRWSILLIPGPGIILAFLVITIFMGTALGIEWAIKSDTEDTKAMLVDMWSWAIDRFGPTLKGE